jgi:hypothetical protein
MTDLPPRLPPGFDPGEWCVEDDPQVPGSVQLTLTHLAKTGVDNFVVTLSAADARDLGNTLIEFADEVEEDG